MLAARIPLDVAVEPPSAAAMLANGLITAAIMGLIALGVAAAAGIPPEPLLIVMATGVSIDCLTPIGQHNNTIVMGVAGYRFFKVGWPVTLHDIGSVGVVGMRLIGNWHEPDSEGPAAMVSDCEFIKPRAAAFAKLRREYEGPPWAQSRPSPPRRFTPLPISPPSFCATRWWRCTIRLATKGGSGG
jgi:hypothetical protein